MNKKIDIIKIAKIGGTILSVCGMLVTSWVSSKENEKVLEKLIEKRLQK